MPEAILRSGDVLRRRLPDPTFVTHLSATDQALLRPLTDRT
jgi:hypothetical protein